MRSVNLIHLTALVALILLGGFSVTALLSAETPHGNVSGMLTLAENGVALPHVPVTLTLNGRGDVRYKSTTDAQGHFTFDHVVIGKYSLIAETRAHQQPTEVIEVAEGATAETSIVLKPTPPYLRLHQLQRVYTTKEVIGMRCYGFVPDTALTINLYRFTPDAAPRVWNGWLPGKLTMHEEHIERADLTQIPELHLVGSHEAPVTRRDIEGVFRVDLPLGILHAGTYLVEVKSATARAINVVAVTDLGLVVKAIPSRALVYAVNLITGAPAAGIAVEMRTKNTVVAQITTDANGLGRTMLPTNLSGDSLLTVGRAGDSIAVASTYISEFDQPNGLRVYTYTDRPIYRPGHKVSFKAVLRQMEGTAYVIPAEKEAQVRVTDARDDEIYTATLHSNAYGSLSGDFILDDAATPGLYTINLIIDGKTSEHAFSVAEYKKPEFEVTAKPSKSRYGCGETAEFTVSAQYYFGAPVTGATVSYYITREPSWYYEPEGTWDADLPTTPAPSAMGWQDAADFGEGEMVASGEGRLDDAGHLLVQVPPPNADEKMKPLSDETDWRYAVHATVTDPAKRSEQGSGEVLITQGDFRVQIISSDYLTKPGVPVTMTLQAIDYNNAPQPQVSGTAEVVRAEWHQNNETERVETTVAWQTDAKGQAVVTVTPLKEGDYRLKVHTTDRQRRHISAMGWLWVMGNDDADFEYPYQDLDVRADKRIYHEGDTAEIVINTRHTPQRALLTLEGENLLTERTIELTHASTVIKLPVKGSYLPNIDVGVCFVAGKHFYSGQTTINVSRTRKALQVHITPEKAKYEPGEQATFHIKTTTPTGLPVASELSIGVVDEAIYAIAPDDTENIVSFFYPRNWNPVRTTFSFPEVYLSGDDKTGSTIRTRSFFPDTACWKPSVVTNAQGEATVTFIMPDNLTTWRATCRAATRDTLVGEATATTLVTKPFLVRLETPRFLTQGDTADVAVIAHNNSDHLVVAQIGLNGKGLTVGGEAHQSYQIEPGKVQRVTWTVTATSPGTVDIRGWAGTGTGPSDLSDAMLLSLPVKPKGRQQEESRAGRVTTDETIAFSTLQQPVAGTVKLTLRLAPSQASAMLGSLEYLAQYPYGCTEQTMSCFLPDVLVAQLLQQSGVVNPALRKELPKMVHAGFLKLYSYQHDDGGWGWWLYDRSDPWMTAYVLFGLRQAEAAGYTVNKSVVAHAVTALRDLAKQNIEETEPAARAFTAYVLALYSEQQTALQAVQGLHQDLAAKKPPVMRGWAWAMLALADHQTGSDPGEALRQAWSDFDHIRTGEKVKDDSWYESYQDTDNVAMLLLAATEVTPQDPRIDEISNWLLVHRRGDHWMSTRDTAFTLYGLTRHLRAIGELHPDEQVTITLNDEKIDTLALGVADLFKPERVIIIPTSKIGNLPPRLALHKEGTGTLYYTASLEYLSQDDLQQPAFGTPGLQVSRTYRKLTPQKNGTTFANQAYFSVGEVIEVELTVTANHPFDYLMIEDPLPAGCEIRDRGGIDPYEWDFWWTNQIMRDDRASFAIRYLNSGRPRKIFYRIFAQTAGEFTALPSRIYDMYDPEAWASGIAQAVTIRE